MKPRKAIAAIVIIFTVIGLFIGARAVGRRLSSGALQSPPKDNGSVADDLSLYDLDYSTNLKSQSKRAAQARKQTKQDAGWKKLINQPLDLTVSVPSRFHVTDPGNYGEASLEVTNYDPSRASGTDVGGSEMKIEIYSEDKRSEETIGNWLSQRPSDDSEDVVRRQLDVGGKPAVFETGYGLGYYAVYYIDRQADVLIAICYSDKAGLDESKNILKSIVDRFEFSGESL